MDSGSHCVKDNLNWQFTHKPFTIEWFSPGGEGVRRIVDKVFDEHDGETVRIGPYQR